MKITRITAVICLVLMLLCVSGCAVQVRNAVTGDAPTPLLLADNQCLFMNVGPHSAGSNTFYCYDGSSISSLGVYDYLDQGLYDSHALINDSLYLANNSRGIFQIDIPTKEITSVPLFSARVYSVAALNNQLLVLSKTDHDNDSDYKLSLLDPITLKVIYTSPTTYSKNTTGTPMDICTDGDNVYLLLDHAAPSNTITSSILKLDEKLEPVCEVYFDTASAQIPSRSLRLFVCRDCIYLYGGTVNTIGILQDDTITPLLSGENLMPAVQVDQTVAPVFYDTEKNRVYFYEPTSKTLTETPIHLEADSKLVSAAASKDQILLFIRQEDPDPAVFDFIYVPMLTDRNLSGFSD